MPNDGRRLSLETLRTEAAPSDVTLLVPEDDVADPELSIVIPALNEELTVGDFVDWCKEGLAEAGIAGEVLIVDSSSDATAEIALAHGARVLKTPKRGLGRAYIDALPFIRGRYVLMGDADCTYDFRELEPFVEKFREGYEFVMGSRWRGSIEPGAMPFLHQLPRHSGDDVDPQPALRQPFLGHPLRHARDHHATRSSAWICIRSPGSTRRRWS